MLPSILRNVLADEDLTFHSPTLFEVHKNTHELQKRRHKAKQVVIVTGPTGAGTDTVIESLPHDKFVRWRTWTTRTEMRNDGIDKDKYIRVDKEEFFTEVKKGNFIEHNPNFVENAYGTHKREAEKAFSDGRVPVLQIDPTGAENFNKFWMNEDYPFKDANLFHFYLVPPSTKELKYRLIKREQDRNYAMKRFEKALSLLPYARNAHYILVNRRNKVDEAVNALTSHLQSFGQAV